MTDYIGSLVASAERNGREAADAAAQIYPGPWDADLVGTMLDHLAVALVQSFPGGSENFLQFADVVVPAARIGFHRRRREMGKTIASDLPKEILN